MRRVARRVVVFTFDSSDTGWRRRFWLTRDCLPEVADFLVGRPSLTEQARANRWVPLRCPKPRGVLGGRPCHWCRRGSPGVHDCEESPQVLICDPVPDSQGCAGAPDTRPRVCPRQASRPSSSRWHRDRARATPGAVKWSARPRGLDLGGPGADAPKAIPLPRCRHPAGPRGYAWCGKFSSNAYMRSLFQKSFARFLVQA
jgi:hypothetical protein